MSRKRARSEKVKTVMATPGRGSDRKVKLSLTDIQEIGRGVFGVVYRARLLKTGETVAMKEVVQNQNFKHRELEITRQLDHCNIVKLLYFYHRKKKTQVSLHLILEFFPHTLASFNRVHRIMPITCIMVYTYQIFRGIAYLHSLGICHRDIKPSNLLVNPETRILKVCDFGSAKHIEQGETCIHTICARSYRAPELFFCPAEYTTMIDVWSVGCILAELSLGHLLFPGSERYGPLTTIMTILGSPTEQEIQDMNKNWQCILPLVPKKTWYEVFKDRVITVEAIDLISRLLVFSPSARLTPLQACAHKFYDLLRRPNRELRNQKLPPLFNFTEHELKIQPDLNSILVPPPLRDNDTTAEDGTGGMEDEPSMTFIDWSSVHGIDPSTLTSST